MPTKHERATLSQVICITYFETEHGTKGILFIQRWLSDVRPNNDPKKFYYSTSVSISRPGTSTFCGAIDILTANIGEILPWITSTADACNKQLKLDDTKVVEQALADLGRQFEEFLPFLRAEDRMVKEYLARLGATE